LVKTFFLLITFVFCGDGSEKLMTFSVLILFRKHNVCDPKKYTKTIAQLIFNCPLLPNLQSNLHGKWPMAQKFLATPLMAILARVMKTGGKPRLTGHF